MVLWTNGLQQESNLNRFPISRTREEFHEFAMRFIRMWANELRSKRTMVEWRACLLWSFGNGSIILLSFRGYHRVHGRMAKDGNCEDVDWKGCPLRKMSARLKEKRKNLIRDFSKLDGNCEKFANGKQF